MKIGIDAGHGINTAGKRTPDGIHEWSLNDKVRDYMIEILREYSCEIICSDDYDDGQTDIGLTARKNTMINNKVDVYVSIHHNALSGVWGDHTGVEVYVDRNYTEQDRRLAELVNNRLSQYTGLKNRGIKEANFTVINQNQIPAELVEGGFMDSNIDHKVITSEEGQRAYAKAVAEALIEFLNLTRGQATVEGNTTVPNSGQSTATTVTDNQTVKGQIGVDGKWGQETTRKAQKVFGTPVDGIVSNQYSIYKNKNKGLLASTFDWKEQPSKNGSVLIGAIQERIGVKKDGFIGTDTIKGMQKWLGTTQDGYVSNPSEMVRAFQEWLNKQ